MEDVVGAMFVGMLSDWISFENSWFAVGISQGSWNWRICLDAGEDGRAVRWVPGFGDFGDLVYGRFGGSGSVGGEVIGALEMMN